jgi:hypothetical protein
MERTAREIMDHCQDLVNNIREYPEHLYKYKSKMKKIESMIHDILDDILEEVGKEMEEKKEEE